MFSAGFEHLLDRPLESLEPLGVPMLVAFNGPADAGGAVTQVVDVLLSNLEHEVVCTFDSDVLYDYRDNRGVTTVTGTRFVDVSLPSLVLYRLTDIDGASFLLLAGTEPDRAWVAVTRAVLAVSAQLVVSGLWCLMAAPWAVPHTRPVSVWVSSDDPFVRSEYPTPSFDGQAPASLPAMLQVLSDPVLVPVSVVTARVPHYLAQVVYPAAADALLAPVSASCKLRFPQVEGLGGGKVVVPPHVAQNPFFAQMVSALEEAFDADMAQGPVSVDEVDAKELVAQIETFLADHRGPVDPEERA